MRKNIPSSSNSALVAIKYGQRSKELKHSTWSYKMAKETKVQTDFKTAMRVKTHDQGGED